MSPTLAEPPLETNRAVKTALVVDDVEDMLDLLEIALHSSGFHVLRASSFAEAMEIFEHRAADIDLLMTDVHVGRESGLELARRLIGLKPSLHVLAISGFAIDGKIVSARSRVEFLPKPFSTSELRKKLQSIFAPPAPARVTVTISANRSGDYTVAATCSPTQPRPRPTANA